MTATSRIGDRALIAIEAIVGLAVVSAIVGKAYGAAPTFVFVACGISVAFTALALVRGAGALTDRTLDVTGRIEDEERDALEHEKVLLLQGIKELEADYAIGKVAPEDYEHLRRTAEQRAMKIIDELKRSDEKWLEEAERLVEKRIGRVAARADAPAPIGDTDQWRDEDLETRQKRVAYAPLFDDRAVAMPENVCAACGTENDEDAKFCNGCGRPKEAAA